MRVKAANSARPAQAGQLLGMVVALIPLVAAWNPVERPNRAVTDGNASLQKGSRKMRWPTTTRRQRRCRLTLPCTLIGARPFLRYPATTRPSPS